MQPEPPIARQSEAKDRSPGNRTHFAVYAAALTALYFASTPEITGNLTEAQERSFHVAAVRTRKEAKDADYVSYPLYYVKAGKVDLSGLSFLLPRDAIPREALDIPGGDFHEIKVLERHPDWQLVEYRYGNSHDSTSRYRAYKDRVEPVSYRATMHLGIFVGAIILLIPVYILSAVINALWNKVARRKGIPD